MSYAASKIRTTTNYKPKSMLKKSILVHFKVLSQHLFGGTNEKREAPQ